MNVSKSRYSCAYAWLTAQLATAVLACITSAHVVAKTPEPSATHYIELRSRIAGSYTGHTYAMYGRLGRDGQFATRDYVGLHPAPDPDVNLLVVGHFISVKAITEGVKDDKVDAYVTSRFRVDLGADEYGRVVGYIADLRKRTTTWHAALNNCNGFVGKILSFMGYQVPENAFTVPETYIDAIRRLNRGWRRRSTKASMGTPRVVSKTVAGVTKPSSADAADTKVSSPRLEKRKDPFQSEN